MYKHYKNGYYISKNGKVKRLQNNKVRKIELYKSKNGYLYFILYNDNNQKIWLHRVVAELFILKPKDKWIVDHIDGNRINNRTSNLRWVTKQENCMNKICHRNNA